MLPFYYLPCLQRITTNGESWDVKIFGSKNTFKRKQLPNCSECSKYVTLCLGFKTNFRRKLPGLSIFSKEDTLITPLYSVIERNGYQRVGGRKKKGRGETCLLTKKRGVPARHRKGCQFQNLNLHPPPDCMTVRQRWCLPLFVSGKERKEFTKQLGTCWISGVGLLLVAGEVGGV